MVLKVGERKVYTTPSSLANRMGVVKGQTGDGFAYAAEAVAKTLDGFAKRQAVVEEENWKNDFKLKTYQSLSKFARENPSSPTDYMAQSSSYIETSLSEAPDKFKSWAKSYAGMMSAQNFNGISLQAIKKKQIEAVTLFNESSSSEIADMNDLILNTNASDNLLDYERKLVESKDDFKGLYPNFTTLFGENILPRISELVTSYTKLYNSLDPSFLSQMDSPEEYMRKLKIGFEQSRVIADDKQLLDQAIALEKEGFIGSKVTGWTSIGAVDKALALIGEKAENYLFEPDGGDSDGPFVFRDTTQEERQKIKEARLDWATKYGNEFKQAEDTLTNIESANIKLAVSSSSNYDVGALNDARTDWSMEEYNSYIQENFYGASAEQLSVLNNAYIEGQITREAIKLNDSFDTTIGSISSQLKTMGINVTSEKLSQIKLNIINSKMVGYMKQIDPESNGIFNPNAFNINTIVMEAGDGPVVIDNLSASFQAAINLASAEGIIHPQLKNMMNTATRINTNDLSDINQLYKLAEINNQLTTRFGSSVNLMDFKTQDALEIFWNDVSNKPDNIDLKFYADKYLSIINPDATDYDEKKSRLITIMETKGLDFAEVLETEFVGEEVFRFLTGSSKLELVPQDYKDAQFLLQNTEIKEVFNEYVYEYLIAFNPKLSEIVPSKFEATGFFDIGNWFKDGNEAGQQGVKAIQYAIKRLGQEGYGYD
tara:strand:+ start:2391 stop:4529 length:2139 start_codon:yes stop_codon:yes gene_type:complete